MKTQVLGEFGKGLPDRSVTLDFCRSGGKHCDLACPYFGKACYAKRTEIRPTRVQLARKLERHESADPVDIADRARVELERRTKPLVWLRISTYGSLPNRPTKRLARSFQRFVDIARASGADVHVPVETAPKADRWRKALPGVVVRESCVSRRRFLQADKACSFVVGKPGQTRKQRLAAAKRLARRRTRLTGRKTIVCPGIASFYATGIPGQVKCGQCTACAQAHMDVIYPLH